MQPPNQHSWINLVEIKGQIIKKLGLERSKQYFDYLNRFLSLKLSKSEFDKLCLRTVGKDNIRLHNQLIRSVLKNAACTRKVSNWIHDDNKKPSDGLYHQNGSGPVVIRVASPLALANGDILPPSPRKPRTRTHDRRVGDLRSALGPNGKTSYSLGPNEDSLGRKDGKGISDRTSLRAPLGVPFCHVSIGRACRALPSESSKRVGLLHTDGLLETRTLKERMDQITVSQGLQQVSMDCANVLNSGLDAYLKALIRSCAELNQARSRPSPSVNINGVRPGHHHQIQSNGPSSNAMQEPEPEPKPITLLDFRVAMELNRKQLGEDWPVLLEKIRTPAFEE